MNPIWNFSFYIVTWNVGTQYPDDIALHDLLGLEGNPKNDHHAPDFFICGFQEVNAQPQNLITNFFYQDPWVQKLKQLLKPRDYVVVKTEQMQGLLLTIFTKRKHLMHVRDVETDYIRTGFGGVWGNKGGISIRLNAYGCSVCIVNSHLAAHDHMLDQRISDYQRIVEATKYSVKVNSDIFSHDYVFWFGDLNFRLQGDEPPEDIRAMVNQEKFSDLLRKDQLMLVMCENKAFSQLVERSPQFPPTFKFVPGTNDYDMKRRPAWCDRILYKNKPKSLKNVTLEMEQMSYKSHPNYTLSDHKPVTSEFKIKVPDDEPTVEIKFRPFFVYNNSEVNTVEYILPANYEDGGADWIGVYKEDFSGLEEYLGYEFSETAGDKPQTIERKVQVTFPESLNLPLEGNFRFLYFRSTGMRGATSLLGISEPFRVIKRCPSPNIDTVD
jgi:inositol-1,4,5-trisphosphate 5-phosphatase